MKIQIRINKLKENLFFKFLISFSFINFGKIMKKINPKKIKMRR